MKATELEENIQFAFRDAHDRGLEFLTTEHLLLVLLDSRDVGEMLASLKADCDGLRSDLEDFLAKRVPRAGRSGSAVRPTPGFHRVMKRAASDAKNGKARLSGVAVVASVYDEPESFGARYLVRRGVNRKRIGIWQRSRERAAAGRASSAEAESSSEAAGSGAAASDGDGQRSLARNLTVAARRGQLETPLPRAQIESALLRVLCRKYKSNPVLVGEPGVGKTALVRALAQQVAAGRVPSALAQMEIHEIQVGALVAGTRYRGDFEARMRQLIGELSQRPNALLFVDEIHTLIGAGAVAGSQLDAANILKPALVDGSLRCIGATTPTEYARVFAKDSALARRFQKIEVPEPDDDEAAAILRGLRPRLETHHRVRYRDSALTAAVRLARRYVPNRALPDKAIDLLDDVGAARALAGKAAPVDAKAVAAAVAKLTGMPASALGTDDRAALRKLDSALAEAVFGQPAAVAALAAAVRRARLGFAAPNKPVGSFMFAGPTGVGKTALAAALAQALGLELIRFDMSEYMERHAVSRLIGAPPGYVGFEQSGQLTERAARHPHCVLLLDEIEKAHPDIHSILLQIMDYGALTDSAGQRVDFSHAVVIMTTNAGAEGWERSPIGFVDANSAAGDAQAELKRCFTPEFRNRLDAQIAFGPLDEASAAKVVDKELAGLAQRLRTERSIEVSFATDVAALLLQEGFSASMGARPLQRAIEHLIVDAIVAADLRRRARPGARIVVSAPQGKVAIEQLARS